MTRKYKRLLKSIKKYLLYPDARDPLLLKLEKLAKRGIHISDLKKLYK
jgi:hypothetical protein